jgi:hypothetical protein
VSAYSTATPSGGQGWKAIAGLAQMAYERLAPAATAAMEARGDTLGWDVGRQQIGGMGGNTRYRNAIASIESAGSGDYAAVGATHPKLGRALGRYQIMEANIGPWSMAALGREVTVKEFMENPGIQDAIFDHRFGVYVSQFGEHGAAEAWFAGPGGVGKSGRADVHGTTVGEYGRRFMAALAAEPADQPVMLKDADGNLTSRLYSPLSGPILQAHNAAAMAGYGAAVSVKAAADLTGLANANIGNPEAFQEAARAYVDEIIGKAPAPLRGELRRELEMEAGRTFLGLLDAQQKETREFASRENMALIEKRKGQYAAAVASGDRREIDATREALEDQLAIRERLPGLTWGPAQSDLVRSEAAALGAAESEKRQKEQDSRIKATIKTIIKAAKDGREAADEWMLDDPHVAASYPAEVREALAYVTMRDRMGAFLRMTPGAQRTYLADMRNQLATEDWEIDLLNAAEDIAATNAAAWKDDSIARAQEVLRDVPELPPFDPQNPLMFVNAIADRADYAQRLTAEGFTAKPIYVSKAESEALGAMFGKDVPPELKMIAAGAIVKVLGRDAADFFGQLKGTDPTTLYAGQMYASGGDAATARMVIEGQALLDAGMVQTPPEAGTALAVMPELASILPMLATSSASSRADTLAGIDSAARAIYAMTSAGVTDKTAQKAAMKAAVQKALGQNEGLDGTIYGGMQEVGGVMTLLPPDVSGEAVELAIRGGIYADPTRMGTRPWAVGLWERAGMPSPPMLGGQRVPYTVMNDEILVLTPISPTKYRMSIRLPGGMTDLRTADGRPYDIDLKALVEAAR